MNRLSPNPTRTQTPPPSSRTRMLLLALLCLALTGVGCRSQNGNDSVAAASGLPAASFTVDVTTGSAALAVQFTDTSTGSPTAWLWDFGDGATSTLANPSHTYTTAGSFDVSLRITTARGDSTKQADDLIVVVDVPIAGFTCATTSGFAPLAVTCASSAVGATTTAWTFTNTTTPDTVLSSDPNASVTLTTAGLWTVRQDVSNAAGADSETQVWLIDVSAITPTVSPLGGAGPGVAVLTVDTGGEIGVGQWFVDGTSLGMIVIPSPSPPPTFDFTAPGTYEIRFTFSGLTGMTESVFDYVVPDVPPQAGFLVDTTDAPGPADVTFSNISVGVISGGIWEFGDGERCEYPVPDPPPADLSPYCDSKSPTHTYQRVGRWFPRLTVNPGAADENAVTAVDPVTITILDPSFEGQTAAAEISAGWTAIRAAAATQHLALSQTQSAGADAGMPREGDQWAALDGLGTDGTDSAFTVGNGIETTFVLPAGRPVLTFDYVLLFSEPPAGLARDAMTATVSDGATTIEMTTAAADAWSAYDGGSTRYPTLDGSTTRVTPVRVASLDVEAEFGSPPPGTEFTLTIRLTNDVNAFRPPRAYVDDVRFEARAADPITAGFTAPVTIVAGVPADFRDTTCLVGSGASCEGRTSWRWDFGTRESIVPPSATGSALQDPTYVFDEPGDYDVTLWAQVGELTSQDVMPVTVIAAPEAIPVVVSVTPTAGGWDVDMRSDSTSDPTDPIVAWSWDFAGFGTSTAEDPGPIEITQAGLWTIRLTVTTREGLEATGGVEVDLN